MGLPLRPLSNGSRLPLLLEVPSKLPLLVPLMLLLTSTVLSPRPLPEECSTPLTPVPLPPPRPLKLSTSNLPLLLLNTTSRDLRPRLVLSLSPSSSLDLVKVRPTLGCVRLPLSTLSLPLSELLCPRVPLLPLLPLSSLLVTPLFGALSLLLSSWLLLFSSTDEEIDDIFIFYYTFI